MNTSGDKRPWAVWNWGSISVGERTEEDRVEGRLEEVIVDLCVDDDDDGELPRPSTNGSSLLPR